MKQNQMHTILTLKQYINPCAIPTQSYARHNDDTYLNNIHITERDILEAVNNINVNKTSGPDKISPSILKEVKKEISHPLLILFTESLR